MSRTLLTLTTLCLVFGPLDVPALAQSQDEVELSRAVIETNRRLIVSDVMQLTDEEAELFWPVYKEYRAEAEAIGDRTIALINDYADAYNQMTDDKARELLEEYLDIEKAQLKLKDKYVKRFSKVLPARKVTRYYQLENKLDTIIQYDLAKSIPLVELPE